MAVTLSRIVLDWLLFGGDGARRFTQDSPVLPDVWIAYGHDPGAPQDLILTPHREARAGQVARRLRRCLAPDGDEGGDAPERGHLVTYLDASVAARIDLGELVTCVLPMTAWWEKHFWSRDAGEDAPLRGAFDGLADHPEVLAQRLARRLDELERGPEPTRRRLYVPAPATGEAAPATAAPRDDTASAGEAHPPLARVAPGVLWTVRVVGWLARAAAGDLEPPPDDPPAFRAWREALGEDDWRQVAAAALALLGGTLPAPWADPQARVHQVHRGRSASPAVAQSRLAIKADAAWRLFDVSCESLSWAVIDSGIDATHPAFRLRRDEQPWPEPFEGTGAARRNRTRVVATYDFTRIRVLLNLHLLRLLEDATAGPPPFIALPGPVRLEIAAIAGTPERARALELAMLDLARLLTARTDLLPQLEDLRKILRFGRDVDWELLAPLLEVPHEAGQYWFPADAHGTHVAGILAADWPGELQGVCPDLRLYDLRVVPAGGGNRDDEFNVIGALQFLRHLNRQKNQMVVHGANLSLSMRHEVANFACGRTPVCEECERVSAAGVVVVAAAGNNGYLRYQTAEGELEGYHTISLTDPGNAESVITVGATHRSRPHTYGVSYFSSRGPTGDGRSKPDLVAPGEKIVGPVPGSERREMDGTSMAAPHVSGAAAILMARHRELIGQPQRIKQILCATATDLGRERYFQGHGMLDVLRALQSV
ncbi:MAG TPA: S8 family serine peptidase [Thermoanaerobaculia bacterium]|nr:S8 family serine peptidase [Thermoanaerobaculia bacterium]